MTCSSSQAVKSLKVVGVGGGRRRVQVVMRVKGVKRVSVGQGGEGPQGVVVGVVEGEGTAGHAQAEAAQSGATIQVGVGE